MDWLFRHWLRQTRWSEIIWTDRQIRLKCDLWDEGPNSIWWCGTAYEHKATRFLHTLLTPAMTFFGVGANIGYYSLAKLTGANQHYIAERTPHISRLMVDLVAELTRHAELIVVGNQNEEFFAVLAKLSPAQIVVDVATNAKPTDTPARYERLCG